MQSMRKQATKDGRIRRTVPSKHRLAIHDGVVYFGDGDGVFHAVDISTQEMKWQFQTEGEIISSANFAADRVLFGSYDGFLYCLNRENGALVWKFETEGYVHGTPGVWTQPESGSGDAKNFVIVTGCDSYLRVINIDDGTQAQQVDLGAYVAASPAISQNRVYCGTYGTEVLGGRVRYWRDCLAVSAPETAISILRLSRPHRG